MRFAPLVAFALALLDAGLGSVQAGGGQSGAVTETLQKAESGPPDGPGEEPPTLVAPNPLPPLEAQPIDLVDHWESQSVESYSLEGLQAEWKKLVWAKGDFRFTPYGTLWLSVSAETQRTSPGDYVLWVLPPTSGDEPALHVDARSTRLGADVAGPQLHFGNCQPLAVGGKVEIDFQGLFAVENNVDILLRHAYFELKNDDWRLLGGQTVDVVSPLYPGVFVYTVGVGGGNLGYRRTQFRLERFVDRGDSCLMTLQGALSPHVISDFRRDLTVTGAASGWPVVQARAGWTLGPRTGKDARPITMGVSGHVGEQLFAFPPPNANPQYGLYRRTWSVNYDLRVPLSERCGVQCEFFLGENLSSFTAGIFQGIDPGTRDTIRSIGGWFDAWYDWSPRLHNHAGYSIDDPFDGDLTSGRTYNAYAFVNFTYDLTKFMHTGVEFTSWKTIWLQAPVGNSQRLEWIVRYMF